MLRLEEVEINLSIPKDRVGMVLMHTNVELSDAEPFQWKDAPRQAQLDAIKNTLEIAKSNDHEATRTSFTIFPEYSVPGLAGYQTIEEVVTSADWHNDSIVFAGIDGLTAADYTTLCSLQNSTTAHGSAPADIANGHWVNCFVMWAKCSDGQVRRFIQPKIAPAWDEQNIKCQQMHCGDSVFLFKAKFEDGLTCRIFGLICFDWIGKDREQNAVSKAILQKLSDQHPADGVDLHWTFVLKHNPKPDHPTFLTVAKDFFEERGTFPKVNRDNCTLVFANNAGLGKPGECELFGHSSILFSPQVVAFRVEGCPPTFSGIPSSTRRSQILNSCKDVVFRERGACIHSVSFQPPKFVPAGVTGKQFPLFRANVHPIVAGSQDPRVPGDPVPGVVKWMNDKLDNLPPLGERHADAQLANQSIDKFKGYSASLSRQKGQSLAMKMKFAVAPSDSDLSNTSDKWELPERDALKTILDAVTVLGLANPVDISVENAHADISFGEQNASLISVKGETHEGCRRHFDKVVSVPPREHLILVTRDDDNTQITGRERKVTDTKRDWSEGPVFTDPRGGVCHVDFSSVLASFKTSPNEDTLRTKLYELFGQQP